MGLRSLLKAPLRLALESTWLRRVLIYELRTRHFGDFAFEIPLTVDFACPILQDRYVWSFSEIFVTGEYGDFLTETGLPARWLDIGCHAGFFSLYLAWQHLRAGNDRFAGLLIDGDPRVAADVERLLERTGLSSQLRFAHGAIGVSGGTVDFALRDRMGSSAGMEMSADRVTTVPVIDPAELIRRFPPPYDLVKLDIEGAEDLFIDHYESVYHHSSNLLLEWHAWDPDGGENERLRLRMKERGFVLRRELQPAHTHVIEGRTLDAGCHIYRNLAVAEPGSRVIAAGR